MLGQPGGRERWDAARRTPSSWNTSPDSASSAAPRTGAVPKTVSVAAVPQTGAPGLPVTGVRTWPVGIGAGLVAVGAAMTILSRRKNEALEAAAEPS